MINELIMPNNFVCVDDSNVEEYYGESQRTDGIAGICAVIGGLCLGFGNACPVLYCIGIPLLAYALGYYTGQIINNK